MEKFAPFIPLLVFGGVIGFLLYRWMRYGSLVGMSVGARVARVLGEIETRRTMGVKRKLKVFLLERELGQPAEVALGETASALGSWQYSAMKLTAEDARKLARLLNEAAGG